MRKGIVKIHKFSDRKWHFFLHTFAKTVLEFLFRSAKMKVAIFAFYT